MRLLGTLALGMALWGAPGPVVAQNNSPQTIIAPAISTSTVPKQPADSVKSVASPNPIIPDSSRNALADQDSTLAAPSPHKSRSDTVLVVKHSFNHRQQIIAGSVIMTCLMLMMVTMNNYNPR